MNTPNILLYAKMVYTTKSGCKTPKYTIIEQAGYYPPMEGLKGRDGKISMNLMEKIKDGENVYIVKSPLTSHLVGMLKSLHH